MHKQRILIVDDSTDMRELLRSLFADYELCEAADGRTALREISRQLPDLVLLDIRTPGVDGKSILSIIKSNPQTAHIPVIHITPAYEACHSLELLSKGADDIVIKPFDPQILRSKATRLLKIKTAFDELLCVPTILSLISIQVENRIPFLKGHSAKVSNYAELLGQQLLATSSDIYSLKIAGSLILLGYIGIPERVVSKPDALNPADWLLLKKHPQAAAGICSHFSQLAKIAEWIIHHHESFDGTGYPNGIAGYNISLGGRCLAIAEAFSALTSDRPYRKAYSEREALDILETGAGTRWDPELVKAFSTVLAKLNDKRT